MQKLSFLFLLSKFIVFIRHDAANSDVQRRPRCIRDAPWSERARATGEPEFMPSMTITMCSICFPVPPREVPEKEKITLSQRFTGLNPQDIPYEIKTALYWFLRKFLSLNLLFIAGDSKKKNILHWGEKCILFQYDRTWR